MAQKSQMNTKTAEAMFAQIGNIERELTLLKKQLLRLLPAKPGSDLWWEREEAEADEDIKNGRVHGPFTTAKDLQVFLDSLK